MLPSLVVEEVQRGVAETLRTQFESSTPLFQDAIARLIDQPNWVKGPYVQLGLPFVEGQHGKHFFADFETEFPGYQHQETAWKLCANEARSTLIATGTGSGKTECFLYPVLDHVARARQAGVEGVKAIIIYPMNALADDQSGRIAELIHKTPAFKGIRAGLFVGSGKAKWKPGKQGQQPEPDHEVMGARHVITDKEVMRANPPDILLTNYKMLDFLMIRPKDQPLWKHNRVEGENNPLRYLIVDELHTFDGAQGTDLAMLIRRLRRQLKREGDELTCIGTSATLGDASNTQSLRDYAGQVFATPFDSDAVVTETRKSLATFIGDNGISHLLASDEIVLKAIQNRHFSKPEEAVSTYLPAMFHNADTARELQEEINTASGRISLGEELKKHLLFQELLSVAGHSTATVDTITDTIKRCLSAPLRDHATEVLTALLTLVAWARAEHSGQKADSHTPVEKLDSLLTLRVQIWIQELRRVVATVSSDHKDVALASESAVLTQDERLRLPVVQCRHCRTTGWLALKPPQESRLQSSLDNIYSSFFARNKDTFLARIYPRLGDTRKLMATVQEKVLCGQCGNLQNQGSTECSHCQSENLLPIHLANDTRQKTFRTRADDGQETQAITVHDDVCPVCGLRDEQLLIGARTTSFTAHAVERLWSAPLNQHKKLILFSDAVQDAAHRAGYIESKTESHLMRAGIARALATQPDKQPWDQSLAAIKTRYLSSNSPMHLGPEEFVSKFLSPTMEWLRDWRGMLADGHLPKGSELPHMVVQRMQWRAIEELTHRSDIGRTLSRTGVAVLFPDVSKLRTLCGPLTTHLRESGGGLELIDERQVLHWCIGAVLLLIRSGGVLHFGLEHVAQTGEFNGFEFAANRRHWIPHRGRGRPPRFIVKQPDKHGFLDIQERKANPLTSWAQQALGLDLVSPGILTLAYEQLLKALAEEGIGRFVAMEGRYAPEQAFGLNPANLQLCQNLTRLSTPSNAQELWVPTDAVDDLDGLPAWSSPSERLSRNGNSDSWWRERMLRGEVNRVIAHEHTGLLERDERIALQNRFMAKAGDANPWYENLLSATPTLEMGINIGALSSVMLGGVPPNQASFIQRIGRAGRLDGNAAVFTIADASPDGHDQYFFSDPLSMIQGAVETPAIYLGAAEVLRRQLYAFFFDHWVASENPRFPDRLGDVLDEVARGESQPRRFPFDYLDYVNRNEPTLFEAFCRMLGENLTAETRHKLESFVAGTETYKNLRTRFLAFFEEMQGERHSWKQRRDRLNTQLRRLRRQPQDEQTQQEIEVLEKERSALGQRIQQLNGEYLLEAITNAGLLPNYAFPEEGVSLTTVIHGARSATGEEYTLPVHRYSRPAASALAEFAPRNTFYAHKSKVEIDQIDMSVESETPYRFCASCNHLAPIADASVHESACPKCGDERWADGSQSRQMLRLRRAVANIDRRDKTRITEHDEQRNPRYYARRLLMNFDAENVRNAWVLESNVALYGFEFITKVQFHDLNLGQPQGGGNDPGGIVIAGDEGQKPGFTLCSDCGKVQALQPRNGTGQIQQAHVPDCRFRHEKGTAHLLEGLFLFREFESECVRILVPSGFGSGERTTYSFMSALQLGLRKRFGGKVDHLRFEVMTESGDSDSSGKTYIVIYDSIPGGTGYLQQMLTGSADTLIEVLQEAHTVIHDCGCQANPELDGCYQCVLHYRQGRHRGDISRHSALEVLEALVQGEFKRTSVKCLSELDINPDFGSELERRFLPAMKALGNQVYHKDQRFPTVELTQDIKNGHTAYLLTVGNNRYWVDTQVPVENQQTGQELCRPDFVVSATKTGSPMRSVAIFVDGWEWHQNIMSDDARKRSMLMLGGHYRVWSITYEDIQAALQLKATTDLDNPEASMQTESGASIPEDRLPSVPVGTSPFNAIAWLVWLLGRSDPALVDPLTTLEPIGRRLMMRSVHRAAKVTSGIKERTRKVQGMLPHWLQEPIHPVYLNSPDYAVHGIEWVGACSPEFMKGEVCNDWPLAGGLVIQDTLTEKNKKAKHESWRRWLRIANLLQAMPGVSLLTESMLEKGTVLEAYEPGAFHEPAENESWAELLNAGEFVERLRAGFTDLSKSGIPTPSIGVEYEDEDEYRIAEAVWETAKVAFLTHAQIETAASWQSAGYLVIEESDEWPQLIEQAIKETLD